MNRKILVGTKEYLLRLITEYGLDAKIIDVINNELQK